MSHLIVGLGNPGREYENTPHNIGWLLIDHLKFYSDLNWKEKFKGVYADYTFEGEKYYFLKPMTYMNLSGESVQKLMHFFKIDIDNLLVLHDELDLDYGTIAFKSGGGFAGHNGLKSIGECLGTNNFKRLRIGVGRPKYGNVSDWLTSSFDKNISERLDEFLDNSSEVINLYMKSGFQRCSNKYSKKVMINKD